MRAYFAILQLYNDIAVLEESAITQGYLEVHIKTWPRLDHLANSRLQSNELELGRELHELNADLPVPRRHLRYVPYVPELNDLVAVEIKSKVYERQDVVALEVDDSPAFTVDFTDSQVRCGERITLSIELREAVSKDSTSACE
jgi:hypothetical protein